MHNYRKIKGLHSRKVTSLPNLHASFQSSPKINCILITRLISIQWKSSRFLSSVSTVFARNAGPTIKLGPTDEKKRLHFKSLALLKQARLTIHWFNFYNKNKSSIVKTTTSSDNLLAVKLHLRIILHFVTFMVKSYYIYRESDYYIYGWNFITFIVSTLLHSCWVVCITFMVGIAFMVSVTFIVDYYISEWKDSLPFPLQTLCAWVWVSKDECSFSAAFSSNIWKVFMEESGFWYSFTAALILESLYSCSTDRRPRSPLSRDRYITAVELSGCLPPLSRMIFLTSLSIDLSSVTGQCWVHIK